MKDKQAHAAYMREWRRKNPDKVKAANERRRKKRKAPAATKPAVMTDKEYRSNPAISRSELWKINESPEKFKWYREHPFTPTPALVFGQVTHKLLLQPETFDDEFVVAPNCDRRTKAGKEEYDAFLQTAGDRTVVSHDDYNKALEMVTTVRMNPLANRLLVGEKEIPYFWRDELTGEDCKCRLDCLHEEDDCIYIVDYKTTGNAATEIFSNKDVFRYGYHFQAAMYSEGTMHGLNLTERPRFIFIAQEKTAPYAVNVIAVPDEVMLAGLDKYRELLGLYHECRTLDMWPGYNGAFGDLNEIQLPGWMQLGVEEEDDG